VDSGASAAPDPEASVALALALLDQAESGAPDNGGGAPADAGDDASAPPAGAVATDAPSAAGGPGSVARGEQNPNVLAPRVGAAVYHFRRLLDDTPAVGVSVVIEVSDGSTLNLQSDANGEVRLEAEDGKTYKLTQVTDDDQGQKWTSVAPPEPLV
jgi:hypothetical protein